MQTLPMGVFHDQVDVLEGINAFDKLDDVGVVGLAHEFDLAHGLSSSLYIQQLVPIISLDGHFISSPTLDALFHVGIGSFAYYLPKRVVLYF